MEPKSYPPAFALGATVAILIPGTDSALAGQIVGRTYEPFPRYDVRTVDGVVIRDCSGFDLLPTENGDTPCPAKLC